jgi:DNA-binding NarL/FixJ family response regulator
MTARLVLLPTMGAGAKISPRSSWQRIQKAADNAPLFAAAMLQTFIVEDSAVIRDNLIATLEELGPIKVVGTAEDEAGAVRWLNDPGNRCGLAIVDIFLKQGTGLGVLSTICDEPQQRKVVVLTNYATSEMRQACLRLGADRVFDKSNDIEALLEYCGALAADGGGTAA